MANEVDFFNSFMYRWGQNVTNYTWSEEQWKNGWGSIGSIPPEVTQFNAVHEIADQKLGYLFLMLKAIADQQGLELTAENGEELADYLLRNPTATQRGIPLLATEQDIDDATPGKVVDAKLLSGKLKTLAIAGQHKNLRASATGTNSLVSVTADDLCVANAVGEVIKLSDVNLTIDTAAVGVYGLDAGVLAASTWYSLWVISDGVNLRGLISLSAAAPTMPAGYTHKARVGWARTDSTANKYPLAFVQRGKRVQYVVASGSNLASLPRMVSGPQGNAAAVVPTFVPVSVDAFVPSTAVSINLTIYGYAAGNSAIAAPNPNHYGVGGVGLSGSSPLHISTSYTATATHLAASGEFLLESRNVYFAAQANPSGLLCLGWEDSL